jgi:hypothetical protein
MPVFLLSLIHDLALRVMYGTYEILYKGSANHKFLCNCPVCQTVRELEHEQVTRVVELAEDSQLSLSLGGERK